MTSFCGSSPPCSPPPSWPQAEILTLLGAHPDAKEIVVERGKFARYAEVNGTCDEVLTMLSGVEA
jgi:hypothetical protein